MKEFEKGACIVLKTRYTLAMVSKTTATNSKETVMHAQHIQNRIDQLTEQLTFDKEHSHRRIALTRLLAHLLSLQGEMKTLKENLDLLRQEAHQAASELADEGGLRPLDAAADRVAVSQARCRELFLMIRELDKVLNIA